MRIKSFKFNGEDKVLFWCCFDIRRVMGAMLRTYQITMGRAYYKCTLRFSSTSNVTDTVAVRSALQETHREGWEVGRARFRSVKIEHLIRMLCRLCVDSTKRSSGREKAASVRLRWRLDWQGCLVRQAPQLHGNRQTERTTLHIVYV